MLNKLRELFGLCKPEVVEAETRRKVVRELRSSAFMHCDVDKERVLLAIEHGADWRNALRSSAPFSAGGFVPPRRSPTEPSHPYAAKPRKPVTDFSCATDDTCGFPLHLPPTAQGGPSYPPHHAVKISGDSTECLDCGERWDTNDPEPPSVCVPRDPMKFMFDEGFSDFPFRPAVSTEVTSEMPEIERIARNLFAEARAFRYHDETQYEVTPDAAYGALIFAKDWLKRTPFISSEQGAVNELERIVARMVPIAVDSKNGLTSLATQMIYWCQRNPLN